MWAGRSKRLHIGYSLRGCRYAQGMLLPMLRTHMIGLLNAALEVGAIAGVGVGVGARQGQDSP